MKHGAPFEFAAVVGQEGTVTLPRQALEQDGLRKGDRVVVRVTSTRLAKVLEHRGVTEAEVERIASMQMEGREAAIRFLLAEGALGSRAPRSLQRRKK
jgi:hypothetical protein